MVFQPSNLNKAHIALDCGGTATTAACSSSDGQNFEDIQIQRPGNIRTIGVEDFTNLLSEVCNHFEIRDPLHDVASITLGVAGYETPEDLQRIHQAVHAAELKNSTIRILNDSALGLTVLNFREGAKASLVSGTGANSAFEFEEFPGIVQTVGGSWYLGSDYEAGGVGIGIQGFFKALHELQSLSGTAQFERLRSESHSGGYTPQSLEDLIKNKGSHLVKLFVERLGVTDMTTKYPDIYDDQPDGEKIKFFSPLAPLVSQAALLGDPIALEILGDSGKASAKLLQTGLVMNDATAAEVALIGGVITKPGPARNAFEQAMNNADYDLSLIDFPKTQELLKAIIEMDRQQ
jgi:N-acetylglucosamine kinase-like BadF-type ATPase